MILEISSDSRVCQVLANFRRKQLGLISPGLAKSISKESANIANALDLSVSKTSVASSASVSPSSSRCSSSDVPLTMKNGVLTMQEAGGVRRFSSPVSSVVSNAVGNEDLFECEGNIGQSIY